MQAPQSASGWRCDRDGRAISDVIGGVAVLVLRTVGVFSSFKGLISIVSLNRSVIGLGVTG